MDEDMTIRAAIRDEVSGPLQDIREELRQTGREAEKAGAKANIGARGFDRMASGVGRMAKTAGRVAVRSVAALAVGAGIATGAAVTLGIKTAAAMQTAKIGFTTMLGSAKKANSFLADLAKFAAKTPFEFPELQTAASSLISAGIHADKVIPIMTTLGNVTSGMGTGSEGVQRATVALQQMAAAGRITGEDLNQLRDAGIPVYDLLAKATGKSKKEVVALAQAGKLGEKELGQMMKALETGKGLERFNGLMEKQSASLSGVWSTLKDTVGMGLAGALEPAIPLLTAATLSVSNFVAKGMGPLKTGIADAIALGKQLTGAYQVAGLDGLAVSLGSAFGVDLTGGLDKARTVFNDLGNIVTGIIIPAFNDAKAVLPAFLSPLTLVDDAIGLVGDHTGTFKIALEALIVVLTLAKAAALLKAAADWTSATATKASTFATKWSTKATYKDIAAKVASKISTVAGAAAVVGWTIVLGVVTIAQGLSTAATKLATVANVSGRLATLAGAAATVAWTIALGIVTVAQTAYSVATKVAAAGQWLLNVAMSANPIALIIIALIALGAGFYLLYQKSETFRGIIDKLWAVLKYVGSWIKVAFIAYLVLLGTAWLTLGIVVIKAVRGFVGAVMSGFGTIIHGAAAAFGWIPGLGPKIKGASKAFDSLTKNVDSALGAAEDKLRNTRGKLIDFGKTNVKAPKLDVSTQGAKDKIAGLKTSINNYSQIDVPGPYIGAPHGPGAGKGGDTSVSHARGRGNIGSTLAAHRSISAASGAKLRITNTHVGGGGKGRGSGDHQAGRALDLQGSGAAKYGRYMREAGGFAEFHGSGANRHLHAVPPAMGDTSRSMAASVRTRAPSSSSSERAPVVIGAGAIQVNNPSSTVDLERGVADGIEKFLRDAEERG